MTNDWDSRDGHSEPPGCWPPILMTVGLVLLVVTLTVLEKGSA